MDVRRFEGYERRYQENVRRIGEFQRKAVFGWGRWLGWFGFSGDFCQPDSSADGKSR